MQFRWNLQLLTRYSRFRNLPCFTNNLLMVEVDRFSVALKISAVLLYKIKFYCVYGKMFFLSKSTSHLLSVPITLECVDVLSWFISFFSTSIVSLMMFCVTSCFHQLFFWFWSVKIWYVKLSIPDKTLKAVIQN